MNNQYQIRVHSGGLRGQAFVINKPEFQIGRDPSCDIILTETAVSRVHAIIFSQGVNTLVLVDNNSTNGTVINNVQVTSPVQISENDVIMLGGEVALAVERVPVGMGVSADFNQAAQSAAAAPAAAPASQVPPFYAPNQPVPTPDATASFPESAPAAGSFGTEATGQAFPGSAQSGMVPNYGYGQNPYGAVSGSDPFMQFGQPAAPNMPMGYPPQPSASGFAPTNPYDAQTQMDLTGQPVTPESPSMVSGQIPSSKNPNMGQVPASFNNLDNSQAQTPQGVPQPEHVSQYSSSFGTPAGMQGAGLSSQYTAEPTQPFDPMGTFSAQQSYPTGQQQPAGYDPMNPYGAQQPQQMAQPGFNPANPYGGQTGFDPMNPYGQQMMQGQMGYNPANPYGQVQPSQMNPYGQPQNPYGQVQPSQMNPYGQMQNPYGQPYPGQPNPYGYDPNYNPATGYEQAPNAKGNSRKLLFIILGIVLAIILIVVILIVYVDANYLWCDWFPFLWSADACQNYPPAMP